MKSRCVVGTVAAGGLIEFRSIETLSDLEPYTPPTSPSYV